MVEDVAQFSLRGGIFDIYGFGMAEPVRLEFWGDEVVELKHFDLLSQRSTSAHAASRYRRTEEGPWRSGGLRRVHGSETARQRTRDAELALVLPVDGAQTSIEPAGEAERLSIVELWAPDTLVVVPRHAHLEPELRRTWDEAQHHIDLARRRGELAPPRAELFETPESVLAALARFGTVSVAGPADPGVELVFPTRLPEAIDRDGRSRGR